MPLARIDKKMFEEIRKLQKEFEANGVKISFSEASRLWRQKLKKPDKKWKFPKFS
jgi:hypothetical protein